MATALRILLGCAAILAAEPCAAATRVIAVDLQVESDAARIVLESERPIRFSLFSLRNPERVLVDLEGIELDAVLAGLAAKLGPGHPYIRSIRARRTSRDVVRIELDLKEEVEPRIFTLPPQGVRRHRLVLEVQRERPSAPERVAVAPLPSAPPAPVAPAPAPPSGPTLAPPSGPTLAPQPEREAAPQPARDAVEMEEALLAVSVNRQPARTVLALRRSDGRLLMSAEDFAQWRFRRPDVAPVTKDGASYFPLEAFRGLSYQVDAPTQTLMIEASPGLFEATALKGSVTAFATPAPPPPGGFVNYEFFADHGDHRTTTSGLMEIGAFGPLGAGVGSFVGRRVDGRFRAVRMETTWTHDRPAQLASFRLGDAISRGGSWGRAARFGGIQWSTNFATQPTFIPFPLPGLAGEAVLPSTVDLFVNDALRLRREVPVGPFSIHDLPVISGRGEARLVVRDVLGREHVITQPYYASPRLLQDGLHDYSYEMGFVRRNFSVASNDYGRYLAVGTHRVGISDRFTAEARGELLRGQRALGVGGVYLWPTFGVASASIAASNGDRGTGGLLALGFEHQSRRLSLGASTQLATERFSQLGLPMDQLAARHISSAFMGLALDAYGSLTLGYTHQDFRDREDVRLVSGSYGLTLGGLGFLSLSVIRILGGKDDTSIGLTFTRPLDARTSASAAVNRQAGDTQGTLRVQRSLPAGTGGGYHALAGFGDPGRQEAGVAYQNEIGTYTLDAARFGDRTGYRASASGGMAFLAGTPFLSRRLTDSFAVASVPGYPGVRVYADNQMIGRTSASGNVLLPRLMPYGRTAVRIEPADLPLDAEISAMQMDAMPYFRSGLLLQFPVRRSRGATFSVRLDDGSPLPAGALVRLAGDNAEFPVGLKGEAYMTGLAETNRVLASWRGQSCEFAMTFPNTADPLPNLGVFRCAGMKP